MENSLPSDKLMLQKPEWGKLTMEQLQKDATLCGADWPADSLPTDYASWIGHIRQHLIRLERQSPELLSHFLYRVDLPEKQVMHVSEELAAAVLKREFMKVWFKFQYRQNPNT